MTERETPRLRSLVIVGLGLVGGSVAMALRQARPDVSLTAIDSERVWSDPRARELVDVAIDSADEASSRAALAAADLALLATPVDVIRRILPDALEACACVTDAGSTKRSIVEVAKRSPHASHFVPGHPMAGDRASGVARSRADLFRGRPWIHCPEGASGEAVARVVELIELVGGIPLAMSPAAHDRAVALTSHVPQILASALVLQAAAADATRAAGPGFASATRVAGGPEAMWRPILADNADRVAEELRTLGRTLEHIAAELEAEPPRLDAALGLLAAARRERGD